ncbi:MAG: proton-conducting transporter membrane subunit [Chloroflexota bacterium]|nr:proton-conducting transporter membrane subunit [Chloroflexota bacterium]
MSIFPFLFVLIPLITAAAVAVLNKAWEKSGDILANVATGALLVLSLSLTPAILRGQALFYRLGQSSPLGIDLALDGLSLLMLIVIGIVCFAASLFSVNYMERYTAKPRYYVLFMLMLAGMNMVVLGADLVNLYVGIEIAALACYALVAFGVEREYLEASFKYQVMGTVGTMCILLGMAFLYRETGSLSIVESHRVLSSQGPNPILLVSGALFLAGFALKAAFMPFHAWLPDAHSAAPSPVSAVLSGIFIKVIGLYGMVRVFFAMFGMTATVSWILMVVASISIILGAFLALNQWDLKRLLAYCTISQMGYILLGLAIATPLGIVGALFHLINHALFKSLFFMNAGSIEMQTGTRDLKELGGLNQRMPVTGTTYAIGFFSVSGMPPFSGFWSKLIIIIAAIQAGYTGFAVVAAVGAIVTMAYFLKVGKNVFFGSLAEKWQEVKEAPLLMCIPMVILAAACLGVGIAFPWIIDNFIRPAVASVLLLGA